MTEYKILIVGHLVNSQPCLEGAINSTQMYTALLHREFSKIRDTQVVDIKEITAAYLSTNVTDIILTHTYASNCGAILLPLTKVVKKHKILSSFMEVAYPVDIPFTFLPKTANKETNLEYLIPAPCSLKDLPIVAKTPNKILIDHAWWKPNIPDMSRQIFNTLLNSKYEVCQMDGKLNNPKIPSVPVSKYPKYIENTSTFETFIVTHKGSYNVSVIDMLARGIRVIAPRDFIPAFNVKRFSIPEFDTVEQMVQLLETPYDKQVWEEKRHLCVDMETAVKRMDGVFQEHLGRTNAKNSD
jgi:hypothetical protein